MLKGIRMRVKGNKHETIIFHPAERQKAAEFCICTTAVK